MFMGVVGLSIIVNVLISFMSKLDDGEYHKFHDNSGWPGILLILVRIMIFIWFIKQCS